MVKILVIVVIFVIIFGVIGTIWFSYFDNRIAITKENQRLDICNELMIDGMALTIMGQDDDLNDYGKDIVVKMYDEAINRAEIQNCIKNDYDLTLLPNEIMSRMGIDMKDESTWKNDKFLEYQDYLIEKYN